MLERQAAIREAAIPSPPPQKKNSGKKLSVSLTAPPQRLCHFTLFQTKHWVAGILWPFLSKGASLERKAGLQPSSLQVSFVVHFANKLIFEKTN